MWISRAEYKQLHEQNTEIAATSLRDIGHLRGEMVRLEAENTRMQGTIDWMKLRLNAVEKERAQLIAAAIGVKIAIPEFVPAQSEETALNEMPNLSTVGGDAEDEPEGRAKTELDPGVDYSQMPGYRANR